MLLSSPTYFVFLGILRNLGVRAVGVASDHEGLIPEAVDEAFREAQRAGELHRVKAIYVVSYFDNPSTATLSLARRPQIVELAQRWSRAHTIHVIDDAAYREAARFQSAAVAPGKTARFAWVSDGVLSYVYDMKENRTIAKLPPRHQPSAKTPPKNQPSQQPNAG